MEALVSLLSNTISVVVVVDLLTLLLTSICTAAYYFSVEPVPLRHSLFLIHPFFNPPPFARVKAKEEAAEGKPATKSTVCVLTLESSNSAA
jgi:hypothetical protein